MTTTVQIGVESREDVLAVPRGALHREGSRTFVYCRREGKVVARPVSAGVHDESYWEVTGGLGEGESVLVGRVDEVAP